MAFLSLGVHVKRSFVQPVQRVLNRRILKSLQTARGGLRRNIPSSRRSLVLRRLVEKANLVVRFQKKKEAKPKSLTCSARTRRKMPREWTVSTTAKIAESLPPQEHNVLDISPGYLPFKRQGVVRSHWNNSAFNIGLTIYQYPVPVQSWSILDEIQWNSWPRVHLSMCHLSRLLTDLTPRVPCLLLSLLFLFRAVGEGCTPTTGFSHETIELFLNFIYGFFLFFSHSQLTPARFKQIVNYLYIVYRFFVDSSIYIANVAARG